MWGGAILEADVHVPNFHPTTNAQLTNVLALPALGRNEERMGCMGPCNPTSCNVMYCNVMQCTVIAMGCIVMHIGQSVRWGLEHNLHPNVM